MPTAKAASEEERFKACFWLMRPSALLAIVISRPSSTHATPRAMPRGVESGPTKSVRDEPE